jgi:hypothetical protein
MNTPPEKVTEASRSLCQIAKRLIGQCPVDLGQEIALIGSAGWGIADEHSDIDLQFWIQQLPPYETITNWATSAGVKLLSTNEDAKSDEDLHFIGRYQGVWVELTWSTITSWEDNFRAILAGDTIERSHIGQAWNIAAAMPLRTQGLIGIWQHRVADYPDVVQSHLIASSSAFWRFPHHIEILWTLAHRGELLGLDEWLFADLQDGLRILFAANRQWEPDWKNLRATSKLLAQTPDQLTERINAIFLTQIPEERIELLLRLLLDILALVPKSYDISTARANIEASLQAHCT